MSSSCCDPMARSPPGSSVHGISQAKILEWGCHFLLQGIFLTQELNPRLLHLLYWQVDSLPLCHVRSSINMITHTSIHPTCITSVTQSCPTLCNPMNRSMPGLPVHHQPPEFTKTHVHRVADAIQPSHPLSSPSPPAPNPSQHQSLFQ